MRIIVTGSREWIERERIENILEAFLKEFKSLTIVHGDCPSGADKFASEWCAKHPNEVIKEKHAAKWDKFGRSAGPMRNREMAALGAHLCIAFVVPGKSRGTADMMECAKGFGIPVQEFTSLPPTVRGVDDGLF